MAESMVGTVKATDLDYTLGTTIMSKYIGAMDAQILSDLKLEGNNVILPDLISFVQDKPELKSELLRLYDGTMGLFEEVNSIPEEVKLNQAALLDGLCFGYDLNTGECCLYTLNFKALFNMNIKDIDFGSICIKENVLGNVKAYRIDVEYTESNSVFVFKAVKHKKKMDSSIVLVPYLYTVRLMLIIERFLDTNAVLKTMQLYDGMQKIRCITKNQKVLKKYCDSESATDGVSSAFFPLKAMFYAPVVGAPSTTAMVTNINLFKLDEVKRITSVSKYVEKSKDPIREMVSESVFLQYITKIKSDKPDVYGKFVKSLPKSKNYFIGVDDYSEVTISSVSKYLHSLKSSQLEKIYGALPHLNTEVERRMKIYGEYQTVEVDPNNITEVSDLLKNHIVKLLMRSKTCSLFSVVGTNKPEILRKIYGNDYFAKYEGFGPRVRKLAFYLKSNTPVDVALAMTGFDDYYEVVMTTIATSEYSVNDEEFSDVLEEELRKATGISARSSRSSSTILLRGCNAVISEDGKVNDYYINIDPKKIVSVAILG